jgi:hypothetical protein
MRTRCARPELPEFTGDFTASIAGLYMRKYKIKQFRYFRTAANGMSSSEMDGSSIDGRPGFGEVLRGHRRAARLTLEQLAECY